MKCYLQLIPAGKEKTSFLQCIGYKSSLLQGKPYTHEQLTNTNEPNGIFVVFVAVVLLCVVNFFNFYSALIFNFYFAYILTTISPPSTPPCPFLHFLFPPDQLLLSFSSTKGRPLRDIH